MNQRQIGCFVAVVVAAVLLSATAASAHATFVDGPTGYPVSTDQTLTMDVPHERDDTTFNVKVEVGMPSGWTAASCQTKATWTCTIGQDSGRQVVTFAKAAGSAQAQDERFGFSVHTASTEGTFAFPTIQTYNTGEAVSWIGESGSDNPAPRLKTLPSGAAPATTAPTAPPTHEPVTTTPTVPRAAPTTSTSTAEIPSPSTTSTTSPPAADSTSTSSFGPGVTIGSTDDSGSGAGPLIAAGVGLVAVAAGAVVVMRRRARDSSGTD